MKTLLPFLLIFIHSIAFAQTQNVFLRIGSTGIGGGYEKKINDKWTATASASYMLFSPSILVQRATYQHRLKATAQFSQLELGFKWYPNATSTSYGSTKSNQFFLKGGLLFRDNGNYTLISDYQKVKPSQQFDANDQASGKLNFKLETNIIQPFLVAGFELINTDNNWSANVEAGLSYHGTSPTVPFVNYFETGNIKIYEPKFNNWARVPKLIRLIKVYPLLNFTIGRRF
jgi:hypothetical protein